MQKLLNFRNALIILLFFISACQPDGPYVNMYVESVNPGGLGKSATPCCVTIDCTTGGSGCQSAFEEWGGPCADGGVCVLRQQLDTVYYYYARNNMNTFYSRYDLNLYFPEMARQRPGAADSLKNGNYRLYVTADSSLAIVRSPLDSIGVDNIVFVYKRNALPVK